MFLFVGILLLGLVYVWLKGDLEWIRAIKGDPRGSESYGNREDTSQRGGRPPGCVRSRLADPSKLNMMAPSPGYDAKYADDGGSVITTRVDDAINWLINWGRANSVWYMLFGLACCAIS